jgi:hypothetical protein
MLIRLSLAILVVASFFFARPARATEAVFESGPTKVHLLELFTSEGCSSCPPADAWMSKLKEEPGLWRDFVPVVFHVDYWDNLGWRDRFASKEWTARQQAYATHWNGNSVYTPGFVLDGDESSAQLPQKSAEVVGTLRVKVDDTNAVVSFKPTANNSRAYEVHLVVLGFALASNVAAGENRGRKLAHDFVVLSLAKAPLPRDAPEVKCKIDNSHADRIDAIAVWITHANEMAPIQATGGWLAR